MQMNQPCIGIDLIEIPRIRRAVSRWGDRFLSKIFTKPEQELYRDKIDSLAVRFAGKEAAIKAMGLAGRVVWREIEILSEPDGKPRINLYGYALEKACELRLSQLEISLSHSKGNAIAIVFATREY